MTCGTVHRIATTKHLGKKEMYIAYNTFDMLSTSLKYTDIVKPGHLNPDLMRYEPHRVHVIEATLKPGQRHIYAKRVAYIDEDTWQIGVVDHFDVAGSCGVGRRLQRHLL